MSIKKKILIPMVVLTVIVASAILTSNILQYSGYVDKTIMDKIDMASKVAENEFETLEKNAASTVLYIAKDPDIVQAISAQNGDALLDRSKILLEENDMDFGVFTDPDGLVLARTFAAEKKGDDVTSLSVVSDAISGATKTTSVDESVLERMVVSSAAPVYASDGSLMGVVAVGYRLDTTQFVDKLKTLTGCETTIFLHDERISTTVVKPDGSRAVGTKAAENVSAAVLAGNIYSGQAKILERDALAKYIPIRTANDSVIGMLFVGEYTDAKTSTVWSFVLVGAIIMLALLAIAIPFILILTRRIVRPIGSMVKAADELALGNTDIGIEVTTKDEMRELGEAFNSMIVNTKKQTQILERIADGDLTVSVEARSEKDVMNKMLASMLDMNNETFTKIVNSASQVSVGARQIADSSQALAQGAAEQSAAVEELSDIFGTMDAKTKENTYMAEKAAALAGTVRGNAEKSTEQMKRMLQAVNDINEANQSISNIIKVIDDIAFQTNILALNAAVEAARAGQQGKGFAVVADEVRNLASKSASAAKNTGALIENSIAKAVLGVRIADETAASLNAIVSGINENEKLVGEISQTSDRQRSAITSINASLCQVTEVVQRNSATAEETAAASQEMSALSDVLLQLTAQFKLRNGNHADNAAVRISLPAAFGRTGKY